MEYNSDILIYLYVFNAPDACFIFILCYRRLSNRIKYGHVVLLFPMINFYIELLDLKIGK